MEWRKELKILAWITGIFLACYFMPISDVRPEADLSRFDNAVLESLALVKWYAREHVLLCLVPAFFIAGAVGVFVRQDAVMRYLGPKANKPMAYGVASVSGTLLAVCSCTILPLFAGIYRMGAGLGPASAFLYSGPAISILAIVLTANVLGVEIGVARAVGAIGFSVIVGLCMHFLFRKEETENEAARRANAAVGDEDGEVNPLRPLWQTALYFASMVGILVFANWGKPEATEGVWYSVWAHKWWVVAVCAVVFGATLLAWFKAPLWKLGLTAGAVVVAGLMGGSTSAFVTGFLGLSWLAATTEGELKDWFEASWGFAKQILPLLLFGVLVAGLLLGRVGHEGVIPSEWVAKLLGGNSFAANAFASVAGAFMYFATLTEVPIIQGLMGAGMGKGPTLALLLAGPALSLPSILVISKVMGAKKTIAFVSLIVVFSMFAGWIFGMFA